MSRPYKITSFDTTAADIAHRFHIGSDELGPFVITSMNPAILSSSPLAPLTMDKVGQVIQLPDDEVPDDVNFEWEPYVSPGNETLQTICDSHNKDKRIDPSGRGHGIPSPPFLEPQSLLDMFRNVDVRGAHGGDATSVILAKGEVLMIPFPRSQANKQALEVTPQGKTKLQLEPPWLTELRNFYESIRQRTRFFENDLSRIRALKRRGLLEVNTLRPLKAVLRLTMEHPSVPKELKPAEMASLRSLDQALDDFRDTAMDTMHQRVFDILRDSELQDILARGKTLLADLRDAHFDELTKKLTAGRAVHPRAMNELCDVLGYAYSILEDSFLADDAATDVGGVTAFLAGGRPVRGDPFRSVDPALADALAQVPASAPAAGALGTVASALSLATASAGNAPGPSSLMVALARLSAVRAAKRFADAFGTGGISAAEQVRLQAQVWKDIVRLAGSSLQEDELVKLGETVRSATDPKAFPAAVTDALKEIDDAVGGRTMAGPKWLAGVGIVSLIALVLSGIDASKNGLNLQNGIGMASSLTGLITALTPAGVAILLRYAALGARAMTVVNAATKFVGLGAGAVGFGIGVFQTIQSFRADDTGGGVLNLVGTVGSLLLLVGLSAGPFGAVVAVIGGVLVVVTGGISLVEALSSLTADDWKDVVRSKQQVWWSHQQKRIEDGDICKQVLTKEPALAAKAAALRTAIDNTQFLLIDASQRNGLSALVPDADSLDALAAS